MLTTLGATCLTMGAKLVLALVSRAMGVSWTLSLGAGLDLGSARPDWAKGRRWRANRMSKPARAVGRIGFIVVRITLWSDFCSNVLIRVKLRDKPRGSSNRFQVFER